MSGVRRLKGHGNGQGFAIGPAHVSQEPLRPAERMTSSSSALARLNAAIAEAASTLEALISRVEPNGAGILEFQVEMLHDPALSEMAADHIATGQDAALAWVVALEKYVAGFEESDDDDIRARAVDVIDIRDRVLRALEGVPSADFAPGAIFVGRDMAPSLFLAHDWSSGGGIVLQAGSMASHVAMLARARAVPMVVGAGTVEIPAETAVLVDAVEGIVVADPTQAELSSARSRPPMSVTRDAPAEAVSSKLPVQVLLNINAIDDIRGLDPEICDGIGLLRTEFLFSSVSDLANEEKQVQLYSEVLHWARGRPVTIRLFDIGGDKPFGGLDVDRNNPFLGLRGIRLLLEQPDILRIQARALLRAGALGELRVLLPMVTVPAEVEAARRVFEEEAAGLLRRQVTARMPAIGMMVEIPAAAMMLDTFVTADFFSLGTNDLAQYLMAAARDNPAVASLYGEAVPVVLRLVEQVAAAARAMGKPVGICGDMAADPAMLPSLIARGIGQISVAPSQIAAIRAALNPSREG